MKLYDLATFRFIDTSTDDGKKWVKQLQRDLGGLTVDGLWGMRTGDAYQRIYGSPVMHAGLLPRHRTPRLVKKWGYHHAGGWPIRDDAWEEATSAKTWSNGILRLVSGRESEGWFSRTPSSWVSLDSASVGIAHWWGKRMPRFITTLVKSLPVDVVIDSVGSVMAQEMMDPETIRRTIGERRGRTPFKSRHLPMLRAWAELNKIPAFVDAQSKYWLDSVIPTALRIIQEETKWDVSDDNGGRLVAGVARMVNSSPSRARRCLRLRGSRLNHIDHLETAMSTLKKDGGYGHPDRFMMIMNEVRFNGPCLT